jgi:cysteine synthase A
MVAAVKGYHLTIFMPSNAPLNLRRLMERYGAAVRLTSPNLGMQGATEAATNYAGSGPDYLLLDIFNDAQVTQAHYRYTAEEIIEATHGHIDAFVASVGTGGTIAGVGMRLKEVNPTVRIIAVEPAGSPVLSSGKAGRHMIPGIGADFVPPLLDQKLLDGIAQVTDEEAGQMCLRLARQEGLLVGLSSGANVFAALGVAYELGAGQNVVTVLPDIGERYVDFPL